MQNLRTIAHRISLALALVALAPVVASAADDGMTTMPHCAPGDPVVWVNTKSHVYHAQGDKYFGKTKAGTYACTSKATAMGAHLAGSAKSGSAASTSTDDSTPTPRARRHKATPAPDATP
jgi:hypothetical protein